MSGFLKRAVEDRARGKRPAPPRAALVAAVAGAAAASITYRVMRS